MFLADEKLSHPTIKTYLAEVRDAHISLGFPDPKLSISMPRLERIQAGIHHVQAAKGPSKPVHLPITSAILDRLRAYWSEMVDGKLYWAVASLCFFGFFCLGEMLPLDGASSPHLISGDVMLDHSSNLSILKVYLRTSKCAQFGKEADVFVGKSGNALCPIGACVSYLTVRGKLDSSAFFMKSDGQQLVKLNFTMELQKALATAASSGLRRAQFSHRGSNSSRGSGCGRLYHSDPQKVEQHSLSGLHRCDYQPAGIFAVTELRTYSVIHSCMYV